MRDIFLATGTKNNLDGHLTSYYQIERISPDEINIKLFEEENMEVKEVGSCIITGLPEFPPVLSFVVRKSTGTILSSGSI